MGFETFRVRFANHVRPLSPGVGKRRPYTRDYRFSSIRNCYYSIQVDPRSGRPAIGRE
jgi:hypothetical protein